MKHLLNIVFRHSERCNAASCSDNRGLRHSPERQGSASVQLAFLKCLGNVAGMLDWGHSRNATRARIRRLRAPGAVSVAELVPDGDGDRDGHSNQPASSRLDLASSVEARLLAMFLVGSPNSTQVRSTAVRQLRNVRGIGDGIPPRLSKGSKDFDALNRDFENFSRVGKSSKSSSSKGSKDFDSFNVLARAAREARPRAAKTSMP